MNRMNSVAAVVAALVVVTASASVAGAVAAEDPLDVTVAQQSSTGHAVVTVTQNGTVVADATVTVDSETPYSGNNTYATDENGTVVLPAPNETLAANVTVVKGDQRAVETVELVPLSESFTASVTQRDDRTATVAVNRYETGVANATVNVSTDGNYTGVGSYETDANGTVTLPAPTENVTVDVTAISPNDANQTATTTATLTADRTPTFANFGQRVSFFVHSVFGSEDKKGGIGHQVSEFVKKHNPGKGNKADHPGAGAGKPDHAGEKGKKNGQHGADKPNSPGDEDDPEEKKNRGNGHGNDRKSGNGVVSDHLNTGVGFPIVVDSLLL